MWVEGLKPVLGEDSLPSYFPRETLDFGSIEGNQIVLKGKGEEGGAG